MEKDLYFMLCNKKVMFKERYQCVSLKLANILFLEDSDKCLNLMCKDNRQLTLSKSSNSTYKT